MSKQPTGPESEPPSHGWDDVVRAVRELVRTLGKQPRKERIARLLDALVDDCSANGEPIPFWLTRARDLFEKEGGMDEQP